MAFVVIEIVVPEREMAAMVKVLQSRPVLEALTVPVTPVPDKAKVTLLVVGAEATAQNPLNAVPAPVTPTIAICIPATALIGAEKFTVTTLDVCEILLITTGRFPNTFGPVVTCPAEDAAVKPPKASTPKI